ncbi:TetR-like C-terminal domain-containing protein [Bacillus halotolerans]|uniref:TetR-like C-terminal domain-containing protein n=1 Tax=Bacillus halotolerans TaxID=260554 RepID=UPI0021F09B87|nr:TetR-like C-terminal domain-containing protein [Bacillus halotolerans]UYO32768.1 TetR family transcriptional regulator C-terminal domain-containing protein [Bacillus halotolerans]
MNLMEVLDDLIRQVKPETPAPVSFAKLFEYIHEHAEYFQVMLSDRGLPQFRSLMAEFVQKRIYEELLSSILKNLRNSFRFRKRYWSAISPPPISG